MPVCREWNRLLPDRFTFVASQEVPSWRMQLGYADMNHAYPFVLTMCDDSESEKKAGELAKEADIMIAGSAKQDYIDAHLKQGKLTFRYSERLFKEKSPWYKYPVRWYRYRKCNPTQKPLYLLCASAYTAADFAHFGLYRNRAYRWGYFPEAKRYEAIDRVVEEKTPHSLLWVGRLIELKHPEYALFAAKRLKEEGYSFTLDIVGEGPLAAPLSRKIEQYGLQEYVHLCGSVPAEKVREYMEKSEIFLFTSDRHEGWGAVLNESMNSACVVVADYRIGSVPFLMEDGVNGLCYHDGKFETCYQKVKWLLDHPVERKQMAFAAYHTIADLWNAEVAAQRLLTLSEKLQNGEDTPYLNGPCSKAPVIKG